MWGCSHGYGGCGCMTNNRGKAFYNNGVGQMCDTSWTTDIWKDFDDIDSLSAIYPI